MAEGKLKNTKFSGAEPDKVLTFEGVFMHPAGTRSPKIYERKPALEAHNNPDSVIPWHGTIVHKVALL